MPTACPSCGSGIVKADGEAAHFCPNRECKAQIVGAIVYYSRRFAMDIDSLGDSLVERLVESESVKVSSIADLYELSRATVESLPRMGKKSAQNLVEAIEASKKQPFERLLIGLGIDLIGQVASTQLAAALRSLPEMRRLGPDGVAEKAAEIAGFGPKMVESLRKYLSDPVHAELLERLEALGVSVAQEEKQVVTGPLSGSSFCVTGVLSRKREEVQEDIRRHGGEVHDKVKKGTTYLVAGEKVGQTKIDGAKKYGAEVIDEATLLRLFAGESA